MSKAAAFANFATPPSVSQTGFEPAPPGLEPGVLPLNHWDLTKETKFDLNRIAHCVTFTSISTGAIRVARFSKSELEAFLWVSSTV